ncbi:molybdopterin-dependent oxidoreductase [Ruegeria sp. HKCCD4884]|nr:molybdopterin-dependent oxidoreductase [Ruegeria sp. HKCCD4884]
MARIELAKDGKLKVLQIDIGVDVGTILNPDAVRSQIQGGTLFGLNMALNEEVEIQNGRVISDNFDTYPILRMEDIPTNIRVHLDATSDHERMGAIGETPVGPIAPAIANAIRQVTGRRIRSMPFRNEDLSWG